MADDEMSIAIPVPRDRDGRITLSDAQWTARLDCAIERATEREGGTGAWAFDRVVGHDEQGNAVVRLRRWRPNERPLPAGPQQHGDAKSERANESRSARAEAARAEAARRQAHREQARQQQRGGQGRDR